jgi:hypothetical protein
VSPTNFGWITAWITKLITLERMMTGESAVARLGRAGTRSTDAYMHAEIREKTLAHAAPINAKPGR